jgi:nitrogen fixation NifU-like protein
MMTSAWDELEELVSAEMRKLYSQTTIDHAMNPRNLGDMEDADGFAKVTGSCGDSIEIWLRVNNGTIADATFMTDGCGTSIASVAADALKVAIRDYLTMKKEPWKRAYRKH